MRENDSKCNEIEAKTLLPGTQTTSELSARELDHLAQLWKVCKWALDLKSRVEMAKKLQKYPKKIAIFKSLQRRVAPSGPWPWRCSPAIYFI